jgi:hypothetical protein
MKKLLFLYLATAMSLLALPAFSQDKKDKVDTTNKLGLAGDGLDLYAVMDLFQKSKTIESFEKSLNDPKEKVNNLDLNLDKKIDFIKVVTEKKDKKDDSYMFILRVDVSKTESQDVAVILLDRDKDKKISLQIVGDEDLYGKDYVVEPKGNSPITPNPAYTGDNPVTVTVEAQPTTVVVQQAPVVQYVYSPAYVPYYPPYYYGYYPGWFAFTAVMSFGFYAGAWGHCHGGYYGGHYGGGNNIIINNNNNFNNYNNNKMRSNQVTNNQRNGNYGNGRTDRVAGNNNRAGNNASNRPSAGTSDRSASNRQSGASNRPSAGTSDRSASNRQSSSASNRQSPSTSNRSSYNSPSTRQSSGYSGGRTTSGSYGGGGGFSGGSRGGGGFSGGGGGGRRR